MNQIWRSPQKVLLNTARTWRGRIGLLSVSLVILAIIAFVNPIGDKHSRTDSRPNSPPEPRQDSPEYRLKNGWVTNCTGPAFSAFPQNAKAVPGAEQPLFKINDELVLAIPKKNWPSAAGIDSEPTVCRNINDLPSAPYVTFVVSGNWSEGYGPKDVPMLGGSKQFQPDVVAVRVEQESNKLSAEEERQRQLSLKENLQQDSTGLRTVGPLTCLVPKNWGPEWTVCLGSPSEADAYFTVLRYRSYDATPFILVLADYPSSRYGRIRVYWKAWTSDVSHVADIDAAVWKSIEDWSLPNQASVQAETR
jgi:hypothetical protein